MAVAGPRTGRQEPCVAAARPFLVGPVSFYVRLGVGGTVAEQPREAGQHLLAPLCSGQLSESPGLVTFEKSEQYASRIARHGVVEADLHRRSEEHTSELQSRGHLVCRLLLEKKRTPG